MTIDHIVPQKESRDKNEHIDNSFNNLVSSCRQCNLAKGSMSLKEFRKMLVNCRHFFKPRKTLSIKFGEFLDINMHTYIDKPIDRQFKFYFEEKLPETLKKLEKKFGPYKSKIQLIAESKRAEKEENAKKEIQKEIESYSVSTFIQTFLTGFAI